VIFGLKLGLNKKNYINYQYSSSIGQKYEISIIFKINGRKYCEKLIYFYKTKSCFFVLIK